MSDYADLSGISSMCTGSAKYTVLSGTSTNSGTANYAKLSGISSLCTGTVDTAKYSILSGTSTSCINANYAKLSGISSSCTGTATYANYAALSGTSTNCSGGTANLASNGLKVGTDQLVVSGGNVGIGTSDPKAKLVVAGVVKITGGSPGINKVLTSDDSGLAIWQTPSTNANYAVLSGTASVCTGAARYATLSGTSSVCTGNASTSNYARLSGTSSVCSGSAKYADLSGVSSACTGTSSYAKYANLSGVASACSGPAKYADLSGVSSACTGTSSYAKYAWLSGNSTTCGTANYAKLSATATECAGSGYYLKSSGLKVNTDQLFVSGGNVGIGTTMPGTKLDVYGSYGAVNFRTYGESRFKGTDNYSHFNYSSGEDTYLRGGKTTSNVYIKDYSGGNVYIAGGGGNVGIGANSAGAKLQVVGDIMSQRWHPKYSTWSGQGDGGAAIVNSNESGYRALMIVGSDQGTGAGRVVKVWDTLDVQGTLKVNGVVVSTAAPASKKFGSASRLAYKSSFTTWGTTYTAATDGFLYGTASLYGEMTNIQLYINGAEAAWIYQYNGLYLYHQFCYPLKQGDTWRFERSSSKNNFYILWWRPVS
jgi:hypothetical protein